MNIINPTPPVDYPKQVVVAQEKWFSKQHPEAAYYLRVATASGVHAVQLPGAIGPGHARDLARAAGFEPTHYTDPGDGRPWLF